MPPVLSTQVHVPARLADIEFTLRMPADFRDVELPNEDVDFTNPTTLAPLFVCMASYGAVLMTVAARPAYDDGTLREWIGFLCVSDGLTLVKIERGALGERPTMVAEATQDSEAGPMRIRTHLFEDGGRLINVSVMAPEAIWPSLSETLGAMHQSFELLRPRGGTVALEPSEYAAASATEAAQPEPISPPEAAVSAEPFCRCLDPEHPTNVRLRDAGVGLVPRVHEQATASRHALIAPAAINALIRVPAGWHVLDDGKRTLLFDAAGRIQISLNLRDIEDADTFLEQLATEHRQQQPSIEAHVVQIERYPALMMRGLRANDELLEQIFLVHPDGCDIEGMKLVARITTPMKGEPGDQGDDMSEAIELADGILRSVKTPHADVSSR